MLLSESKKNALIQLINCKEKWTVKDISDLFDGKLFCDIIKEVFPETYELLKKEGQIVTHDEEQPQDKRLYSNVDFGSEKQTICEDAEYKNTVIKDSGAVQKSDLELIKSAVHDSKSTFPTTSASESVPMEVSSTTGDTETVTKSTQSFVSDGASVSEPIESAMNNSKSLELIEPSEKDKKFTSNRYRLIQYFIDVRYNLKSETVINFSECWEKNEIELAKVLIFIMSEVVRHYALSGDPLIQTLSHVDALVQQDLEQCFNFFIIERGKMTKEEVNQILNTSAHKASSSPNNGYCSTPRSCSSKYKRLSPKSVTQSHENFFTSSPLKTYFESPVFTKADIISKEKEILKMKQIIYEEESNSCSLVQKVQDLEKLLEEKNKEICNLKMRNRVLQEKETSEDCESCVKYENIIKENERRIKELEVDIQEHNEEARKKFEDMFIEYQVEVAENTSGFLFHLRQAEATITQYSEQLVETKNKCNELEVTVKKLSEELDEKIKELDVYKEKLSYADRKLEKEPESPVLGECMGEYFKEENEKASFEISPIKITEHPEEKSVKHVMVQFPEQEVNIEYQVEPDVIKPELPVSNDPPDCENHLNLKKCPENTEKECLDVCAVSTELDAQPKQFVCSTSKEVPFVDNNYPSVTKDSIGSLWQKYENSIPEHENGNNNFLPVTNDDFGTVWQNNNNFIPEVENTDGVPCADNGLTKALSILQKTECDLSEMSKYLSAKSKVSSGPNGSNGILSSPIVKEFIEKLKNNVQITVLCLSEARESQIKYQNNNSISKNIIDKVGDNSDVVAYSKCFECSKVGNDISNSTITTTRNEESSALPKQTQELDNLKDKYMVTLESLNLKEKELGNLKKKYSFLKAEYFESIRKSKEIKLRCQKLENDLKESIKRENDFKRGSKIEKNSLKMHMKAASEKIKKLEDSVILFKKQVIDMNEENKQLRNEITLHIDRNEELWLNMKHKEKEVEEAYVIINRLPSASSTTEKSKHVEGKTGENSDLEITSDDFSKLEHLSAELNQVILQGTGNGNSSKRALQQMSFQDALRFGNCDEAAFINHSSLEEIKNRRESTGSGDAGRVQELCRRNTMVPDHLKSRYPIENLPVTPLEKKFSKRITENKSKAMKSTHMSESNVHTGKKRKVSEMEAKNQSSQFSTPVVKTKRKFLPTPTSLKRWYHYRRIQRSGSIKPIP